MKNRDIKILILYVLFFFVAACSPTKKNKSESTSSETITQPKEISAVREIALDTIKLRQFY